MPIRATLFDKFGRGQIRAAGPSDGELNGQKLMADKILDAKYGSPYYLLCRKLLDAPTFRDVEKAMGNVIFYRYSQDSHLIDLLAAMTGNEKVAALLRIPGAGGTPRGNSYIKALEYYANHELAAVEHAQPIRRAIRAFLGKLEP